MAKKTGRPRKEIDREQFEKLCELQCTESEICDFFDVCEDTLNSWCKRTYGGTFSDTYAKKRVGGKISLRRAQFRLAEKSASMAIWLGRNYLNQVDKPEDSVEAEDTAAYLREAGIE